LDLAKDNPAKLEELKTLFLLEADRYLVTPLDDRVAERFNAELAGRPELIKGDKQILFPGMKRLSENSVIVIKNKSHAVTANISVAKGQKAEGTIISQGGKFGGWSLYAKNGKLKYCYNYMSLEKFYIESNAEIPAGDHQVRMEFTYDGGGLGKGGSAALYFDGKKVGEGRVNATAMAIFSADETLDLGEETGTAVADDCHPPSRFNSTIQFCQIDAKDHYLTPEQQYHIAMARQ
jgi:arylsulfatase